jgi:hypothetical protein
MRNEGIHLVSVFDDFEIEAPVFVHPRLPTAFRVVILLGAERRMISQGT